MIEAPTRLRRGVTSVRGCGGHVSGSHGTALAQGRRVRRRRLLEVVPTAPGRRPSRPERGDAVGGQHRHTGLRDVPSDDELTRLLAAVDRSSPIGRREYAVLILAPRYGMRPSDIRQLRLDDLQWRDGVLAIRQANTGPPLVLPLLPDVRALCRSSFSRSRSRCSRCCGSARSRSTDPSIHDGPAPYIAIESGVYICVVSRSNYFQIETYSTCGTCIPAPNALVPSISPRTRTTKAADSTASSSARSTSTGPS